MVKKQSDPTPAPKPRGRPKAESPKGRSPIAVTIRANAEWQAWFDTFCAAVKRDAGISINLDRTDVVDIAFAKVAKSLGLPEPPSRY